jgi:hypothetical protein
MMSCPSIHNDYDYGDDKCTTNESRNSEKEDEPALLYNIAQSMRQHQVKPLIDMSLMIQHGCTLLTRKQSRFINFRKTYVKTLQKESSLKPCTCQICPLCNARKLAENKKKKETEKNGQTQRRQKKRKRRKIEKEQIVKVETL